MRVLGGRIVAASVEVSSSVDWSALTAARYLRSLHSSLARRYRSVMLMLWIINRGSVVASAFAGTL